LFLRDYVHRYRKLQPQAILEQLLDEHPNKYDARNSKKLQQSIRRLRTKCFQKEFNLQKNSTIGSIDVMLREHEVDLTDPATHNTLDPHQPFTVEVEINVATSLALILVTTLHWLRNAVRSLATQASVLMHDTTHGLMFGGAEQVKRLRESRGEAHARHRCSLVRANCMPPRCCRRAVECDEEGVPGHPSHHVLLSLGGKGACT
jgi:hypothetical protein